MRNATQRLTRDALSKLPSALRSPAYDLASVRAGIVHLGLGAFHRAHMARYTHVLMQMDQRAAEWGIVGAGLLPADAPLQAALAAQDWLYTLVERDADGERREIIGSLCGGIFAGEDSAALLDAIDAPGIRIVSLTVTERGYCLDPATKRLSFAHPLIAADLTSAANPCGAIAVLVEALRRRMAASRPAFTALSCDNIQHNGDVLRTAVLDFAERRDTRLAEWIGAHARFPNSMVDRITPVTTAADIAALAAATGIEDAAPVFCEPFTQWVLEDNFADGRPDWDAAGAQFVPNVTPYEKLKLRLLNASHLALAEIGSLLGYARVDEAMRDPELAAYLQALMHRETMPTLDPVPGVDVGAYGETVLRRFANPTIYDTLVRIQRDAALNYLLDPVRDRLARDASIELLALAIAARLHRQRMGAGRSGDGIAAPPEAALFGALSDHPQFVEPVAKWLAVLAEQGVRAALRTAIS